MVRFIHPHEIANGGVIDGQPLDPVTYLISSLATRFAPLEEESRLKAMTEYLAFQRLPGESIDQLLLRYEIVRQRSAAEGQFTMNTEGQSLQLLRACNSNTSQLGQPLQPLQGRLPANEAEFSDPPTRLRRQAHVYENVPGNISQTLMGLFRQA